MTTSTTDAEAIARIIEAEIEHDIKGNIAWASGRRAATAILSYLASRREAQEPVAWRYRWKIYGEWVSWRVSERSQASEHLLPSLEEYPLYLAPPAPAGEVERLRAAIKRQVENIDRWRETGEPASPEESKSIYEQLVAALDGCCHD